MPSAHLISLGCDKNRADGEVILGLLAGAGYEITYDTAEAELIIVNTCGFIRAATEESVEAVLTAAEYKRTGRCKALIVTGCMSERYKNEILSELPEADAALGADAYKYIVETADKLFGIQSVKTENAAPPRIPADNITHVAYVKIAEGCDNRCAYCAIPSIRGPYSSVPMERVVLDCEALIRRGAKELTLVAQDTALYGADIYGKPMLHELLARVAALDGFEWLRIMYAYPEHITDALIAAVAANPKVCRYLDMPVQHADDAVLGRMGRKSTGAGLREIIGKLRAGIPGVALRTTLLAGFPGETDSEFEALCAFIREMRFDRLGVFAYSREDGTRAARMKGQVKASVKTRRRDILMGIQKEIHREKQLQLRGAVMPVMVDGQYSGGKYDRAGRSYRDAYETDSAVFVVSRGNPVPGDIIDVRITGSDDYDLFGEQI